MQEQLNIYQRVLALMSDLDYIQKGDKKVNNQYRFVSHDQVTAAIHPLLVKHRLLILPHTKSIKQDQNRTEVMIQLTFVNPDKPEECFALDFPGYGIDTGDKGPGKAISYAYKYGALKAFCLETGDDPDNDQNASYEPEKCLDFYLKLPGDLNKQDIDKINEFLEFTSKETGKHIELLKKDACSRIDDFMKVFLRWARK